MGQEVCTTSIAFGMRDIIAPCYSDLKAVVMDFWCLSSLILFFQLFLSPWPPSWSLYTGTSLRVLLSRNDYPVLRVQWFFNLLSILSPFSFPLFLQPAMNIPPLGMVVSHNWAPVLDSLSWGLMANCVIFRKIGAPSFYITYALKKCLNPGDFPSLHGFPCSQVVCILLLQIKMTRVSLLKPARRISSIVGMDLGFLLQRFPRVFSPPK